MANLRFSGPLATKANRHWTKARHFILGHCRFSSMFKMALMIPLMSWVMLFNLSKYIPEDARLPIDVKTLPTVEKALLFGYSLQHFPRNIIPDHGDGWAALEGFFDLAAGFAYFIHFGLSWIVALVLYFYYRKKRTEDGRPFVSPWTFLFVLGMVNFAAVVTQMLWPTAPPWYVEIHGIDYKASYNTTGYEAGLRYTDKLLHMYIFRSMYGQSPVVFGSFPSLHGSWPIVITMFLPPFRSLRILGFFYISLVWWAAIYLNHHWLLDLIGGAAYVVLFYFLGMQIVKQVLKRWPHRALTSSMTFIRLSDELVELVVHSGGSYSPSIKSGGESEEAEDGEKDLSGEEGYIEEMEQDDDRFLPDQGSSQKEQVV